MYSWVWLSLLAALVVVSLGLYYPLFGGSALEGILATRPLVRLANAMWGRSTRKKMEAEGVPRPTATIEYSPGLEMDVYDGRDAPTSPAPCILYFHAGAFLVGDKAFGAGTLGWMVARGAVGISVGYALTSGKDGRGLGGCIDSANAALRYVRSNAASLGIDPAQVVVWGDSAGGLLSLALGTGLATPRAVASVDRPMLVVAGWPCCTVESRWYAPRGLPEGGWAETPSRGEMDPPCAFVPEGKGGTAGAAQRQLQRVLAGTFLLFGPRGGGWLPCRLRKVRGGVVEVSWKCPAHRRLAARLRPGALAAGRRRLPLAALARVGGGPASHAGRHLPGAVQEPSRTLRIGGPAADAPPCRRSGRHNPCRAGSVCLYLTLNPNPFPSRAGSFMSG